LEYQLVCLEFFFGFALQQFCCERGLGSTPVQLLQSRWPLLLRSTMLSAVAMAARPVSSSCRHRHPAKAAADSDPSSSPAVHVVKLKAAARRSLLRPGRVVITSVAVGSLVAAGAANAAELQDYLQGPSGILLADLGIGDWFGGLLYSAGQQANEAVQDQLSALSFTSVAVIFGAGLVTSLSPCTLSVLPLTLGYIALSSKTFRCIWLWKDRTEVVGNSIAFSLGLATTLAVLGVAASFAGKAYGQVGQGLPVAASGLAVIMGLNLLEVVELQLPSFFSDFDPRAAAANLPSSVQAYLAGLTFALAASPCSTPVLATLLGYVATSRCVFLNDNDDDVLSPQLHAFSFQDPIIGGSLLLTYTTGYVAPLLIAASFAGALQSLLSFRRYSAWINPISQDPEIKDWCISTWWRHLHPIRPGVSCNVNGHVGNCWTTQVQGNCLFNFDLQQCLWM
ncbi:hypothetical protein EJB05_02192, partial [Eragrostis curvula]